MQAEKRKDMYKKICLSLLFSLAISVFPNQKMLKAATVDSTISEQYSPFHWEVISDVDKVMQYEKVKDLNKRAIDQSKIGNDHYKAAIKKMTNKNYMAAIAEFKNAMKRYKRAKLGPDAYNYINTNTDLKNIILQVCTEARFMHSEFLTKVARIKKSYLQFR